MVFFFFASLHPGLFCVCAQPLRDDVTLYHHLWLEACTQNDPYTTRSRTRQNFDLVHINGPVQNFGTAARNFSRWRPSQKRRAAGHDRQHVINRRLRVLPTCHEWLRLSPGLPSPAKGSDSSRRARDSAATMLDHSRHRGESATKTVKFFAAHTVNCVLCKNLTRIDWMLLNFTPVIQQNCHQPGRNFEKTFCAVDRLSCQLELSNPKPANSEAILLLISQIMCI